MVKSLIIYDKINIDSIFSAALLKYGYDNNLLKNDDEMELTFVSLDKEFDPDEYDTFTFLNCILSGSFMHSMYVQNTNMTFLVYDEKLVKSLSKEFPNGTVYSLSNNALLDTDKGSCSMYIYRQLRGNVDIPVEIKYISSFELDNYPDYDFTREEVLNYNYGLIKKYNNSLNELYVYVEGLLNNLLNNDDSSYVTIEQVSEEGEDYGNYIDDFIVYNYNVYKGIEIKVGPNNRKGVLLQTPYKLSSNIVTNELFEEYDNIMTFYFLNDGRVKIGLYDLPPVFYKEDENDLTDTEQAELIAKASFNVKDYLSTYNGYGNELYGFATLDVDSFYNIIKTRKF